jgi:Ca2+-binding RTX toxin-like protein
MVSYIRSDLDFILQQIKISEAHAAGQPLYGVGGLIPHYIDSLGLRTVDGSFNNLLPGQEQWGAADQQFIDQLATNIRPAGQVLDLNGPAPGGQTATTYAPSNNPGNVVVDASIRTISNLIVDQTLGNPAAILKGLTTGGIADASLANVAAVEAIYAVYKPFVDAEYQARVLAVAAQRAATTNTDPAQQAALDAAAAATAATAAAALSDMLDARAPRDASLAPFGITMEGDNVQILNTSPDLGLSAPFNSWFTLFGQFFDHGLDLINKGGSGVVYIPLQPDDPLYVPGSNTNFMVLTRATVSAGADGVMGTADDVRPINTTTPFVDQNQTYTSHSSHQVFLRQYVLNAAGDPVDTGHLIEGGGDEPGGMATWGEVKAQARNMLGIDLTDFDVGNVPLLRTDQYGNFIRDANGMPQIITGIGADGIPNTADDIVVSGNLAAPVDPTAVGALRTGHAFLADIAHDAVPTGKIADGDITVGLGNPGNGSVTGFYDNELLDAHFIAGDGRVNENIGLTAVHTVFHAEHNRLVDHTKVVTVADAQEMLANGSTQAEAVAFLNEWLADDVTEVPDTQIEIDALVWDGARLFQAAKFGTEMQYQHAVFEDFARKIQPNIDFFVVPDGYHADINPGITSEFANVVYRFGHSMLTEEMTRLDADFDDTSMGLIEAFLNPVAFDSNHTISDRIAAGDIVRGMTRQVGNEIDEFVTTALRNNLLGLPLDLAAINIARGRDVGVPSLNAARREFYEASQQAQELKPYESWTEFASHLKNEASIINFVAAYGTHATITGAATVDAKRDAAMELIFGQDFNGDGLIPDAQDAYDFLNAQGPYAGGTLGGLENVDFWIGGLAEKQLPFGGMLGSTFGFIFEAQLEALQDGDRFYYLQRLDGLHLFTEMENNTLSAIIQRNLDVGHLPSDVFSTPGLVLEVDRTQQYNPGLGETAGADGILLDDPGTAANEAADNLGNDPTGGSILNPLVVRNNPATVGPDTNYLRYTGADHVLLGGTDGNDIMIASEGDDTLLGDAGNDRLEGGAGNDQFRGGDGDDIITDFGGDDIIRSGAGHDAINAGQGLDLVVSDAGNDFVVLGDDDLDEALTGLGNDFILGSKTTELSLGGEGHDWIEIGAWTGAVGDNFEQNATDNIKGHDVFHGDGGFDEFIGEGGDDIWVQSLGRGKFDGLSGFDWTSAHGMQFGVEMDLNRAPQPGADNELIDVFTNVEGASGSVHNDVIIGTDVDSTTIGLEGYRGSVLDAEGIALIDGLQAVVGAGVTSFNGGNILLGGAGADIIEGRGGDDIIDGDKWLNVRISVRQSYDENGPIGPEIASFSSMKELSASIFAGTINPGQLQIVREIVSAPPSLDLDIARFSGNRADYDISQNQDGTYTVSHARGAQTDGVDTISNVEILRFANMDIALLPNADGTAFLSDQTPTEGQTLTINEAVISDLDGLGPFNYQWQSSGDGGATWNNIAGAVANTFTPQDLPAQALGAQAGLQLRVEISYTDGAGNAEVLHSAGTSPTGANWDGRVIADNFSGTAGDDLIRGDGGSDTLLGNAGDDNISGDGGNDLLIGGAGIDTMTGGTGNDRYQVDHALDTVVEAIGGGTDDWVASSTSYTLAAGVEVERLSFINAAGADNFDLSGNELNNRIWGNAGNNILDGGAGDDWLLGGLGVDQTIGGAGNDLHWVDDASDTVIEAIGGGIADRILTSASYVLAAGVEIEMITTDNNASVSAIDITGNEFSNRIIGNAGSNILTGGVGDDRLTGGLGVDTTIGGIGNDLHYVDNASDVVVEDIGEGTSDRVLASNSYALGAGVAVELLTTDNALNTAAINLTGNEFFNRITGNAGSNVLDGGDGNDVLTGGAGVDTTIGGLGNDDHYVDNVADSVVEAIGDGLIDRVFTTTSFTLAAGSEVEQLLTTNVSGTGSINLTGNEFNNALYGNAGTNLLTGGGGNDSLIGGAGIDHNVGGTGSDLYFIDNSSDTISEAVGEGTLDRVITSANYALAAGVEVEMMSTNSNSGTAAINLTGNEFANRIFGNAGSNVLDGGAGNDRISGLDGNDTVNQTGSTGGHDIIDGGIGSDTYRLAADNPADAYTIYTRDAWLAIGGNSAASLAAGTEIVVTRNGTDSASIISELDNIEEIIVDETGGPLDVTANNGNGALEFGPLVTVVGDFTTTSLDYSTITVNGGIGNETVDISGLTSDHRLVFNSGGGSDSIIGTLRPQDSFNIAVAIENVAIPAAVTSNVLPGKPANQSSLFDGIKGLGNDLFSFGNFNTEFAAMAQTRLADITHSDTLGSRWNGALADNIRTMIDTDRQAFDFKSTFDLNLTHSAIIGLEQYPMGFDERQIGLFGELTLA